MTIRNRSYIGPSVTGKKYKNTILSSRTHVIGPSKAMVDVVGHPESDNAMRLVIDTSRPTLVNGSNNGGQIDKYGTVYIDYPLDVVTATDLVVMGGSDDGQSLATKAAARTNPSRAHVSIPLFFYELKDVPMMLREAGGLLSKGRKFFLSGGKFDPKKGAGLYLSYQFGWKPLLSDLRKMLQFINETERRADELERLTKNGGLKRRVNLGSMTESEVSTRKLIDYSSKTYGYYHSSTTSRAWATMRWLPSDVDKIPRARAAQLKLANRLVTGLHHSQISSFLWNAIPWSWLVDWFTDIGDFIEATQNGIAYLSGDVNLMVNTKSRVRFAVDSHRSWVSVDGGWRQKETKARYLHAPSAFSASRPLLSGRQVSILGSLAILKRRNR